MRLLTVGDSFTYGEELSDLNNAWPFLLGKRLGYEVTNLAKPGSGNTRMVRHCVEHVDDYDIAIIAWSHFARIEMADEGGIYDIWPGNAGNLFTGELSYRKNILDYITRHHDDLYLYRQQIINIILLQNYFKQTNKKYIMLNSFNGFLKDIKYLKQQMELQDSAKSLSQIDTTYYLGWPYESMMEWTYKTPLGPRGHFLEQGHERVADKIYEHIRHLGWIS